MGVQQLHDLRERLSGDPVHLQLLLVHPHPHHNRGDATARERPRVLLCHHRLPCRGSHLRHHRGKHRVNDHQHECLKGRVQEQDGRHKTVYELSQGREHVNREQKDSPAGWKGPGTESYKVV